MSRSMFPSARVRIRTREEQLATKADLQELTGKIVGVEGKIDGLKSQMTTRALLVGASMVALLEALKYLGV